MALSSVAILDDTVEIYKGSTLRWNYQFLDGGSPVDLTGVTVIAKFAKSDYSAVVFTATCTVTDAVNGKVEIYLSDTDTAAATPVVSSGYTFNGPAVVYEDLVFDMQLTLTSGDKLLKVRGTAKFYPAATGI